MLPFRGGVGWGATPCQGGVAGSKRFWEQRKFFGAEMGWEKF